MRIDISESQIIKAIKMLRMLENFEFTEVHDSNIMEKQYQLTLWADDFGTTITEAMENSFKKEEMLTCPHCNTVCIAPPEVFGCDCGYEGKRR